MADLMKVLNELDALTRRKNRGMLSRGPSFLAKLRAVRAALEAEASADPWKLRLERVRGEVGNDGCERISTQALFDLLQVPLESRRTGAFRRLSAIMRELHWRPIRIIARNGKRLERTRGYERLPPTKS